MSDSTSNKAICATTLGVGILIGAGIALLCAPRTGKETRELIGKKAGELKKTLGSWASCNGEQCDQEENAEGSDNEKSAMAKDKGSDQSAQAKDGQNKDSQNKNDQNKTATAQAPQGQNNQNNANNQNKPALQGSGRA